MSHKKEQYTLKELRARLDKTQAEVAKDLGVSAQTYNAWERDLSNIAVSKVYSLARYFNKTIDEIKLKKEA